ncbi:ABC transporter permease [Salinirubellus sp. GCM10025818]|uniref:ABC transporter permease n=1 Tax=Salinirubellus TaxID=2162630 RepID=UPI0030CBE4B0
MLERLRGAVGVGLSGLRYRRGRAALAVAGVALAVLLVVLLAGLGYGLTTTGGQAIDWLDRDLWATAGPVAFAPGAVGGVENPVEDAHAVAAEMEGVEGVAEVQALAFQAVYVSPDGANFDTVVGVGGTGSGDTIVVQRGRSFSSGDVHYANGTYEGPMTHEVIVGPRLAERYGLEPGDTLHVGGTLAAARENEFEVVGVSNTFSRFLGTPTVALHLSELQEVSGGTGNDRAAILAVSLTEGADPAVVERRIERAFPRFSVRTNDEQVGAVIGDQGPVLAAAATLVALAVVAGVALVTNVLALLVAQQRERFAALKAAGVSGRLLAVAVLSQGLVVGLLGGALGLALAIPATTLLNRVVADLAGFSDLVATPSWLLAGALVLAAVVGIGGSTVAGWRVSRISPLAHLRR